MEVAAGERLGLLGLNGAGKTTLLRLLAGIDEPTAGEIRIDGVAHLARRRDPSPPAGLRATAPACCSPRRVRRNVELPLRYRRAPRATRRAVAAAALARLGVEHLADRPAHASPAARPNASASREPWPAPPTRCCSTSPPQAWTPPPARRSSPTSTRALADRATTVVLVSHRAEEVLALADRVAVLVDGELRQAAPGADLVIAARPTPPSPA